MGLSVLPFQFFYKPKTAPELPWWLSSKESACQAGNLSSILGLGRSSGEGNGNQLQYSCLENSMNLECYSSWGLKELDMTEQLTPQC